MDTNNPLNIREFKATKYIHSPCKEGEVISTVLWNSLHSMVISNLNTFQDLFEELSSVLKTYDQTIQGCVGTVDDFSQRLNVADTFIAQCEVWKTQWDADSQYIKELAETLTQQLNVVKAQQQAIKNKFVHYGPDAPTGDEAVWVKPIDDEVMKYASLQPLLNATIEQVALGDTITIHDAVPSMSHLKVKAHRKNLIPYPYRHTTQTQQGITVTDNGDGSLTLNGTGNQMGSFMFYLSTGFTLEPGQYYTGYEINDTSLAQNPWMSIYGKRADGTEVYLTTNGVTDITSPITITEAYIMFYPSDYNTPTTWYTYNNVVIKPFIIKGATNTGWVPAVNLSTVTVKRYGKNILDVATAPMYHFNPKDAAYTYERTKTGFKATFIQGFPSGTWLSHGYCIGTVEELRGKTITIKADYNTTTRGSRQTIYVYAYHKAEGYAGTGGAADPRETISCKEKTNTNTFTVGNNLTLPYVVVWFHLCAGAPSVVTGDTTEISNIQVEINDSATEYEPYVEPQIVPVDEDGMAIGLCTLSPNMTLVTDKGVSLECHYRTDVKSYVDKKFAELSAAILNS